MPRKLPYVEGDWFAVPLASDGYGLGLVARANAGFVLAYFFGPRFDHPPTLADAAGAVPGAEVLVGQCGDLGFLQREWPILGRLDGWDREAWGMPAFRLVDPLREGLAYVVRYDEASLQEVARTLVPVEATAGLPEDGLMGHKFVEARLDRLLRIPP